MTPGQTKMFWRLWSAACATQGWMGDEREVRRKEVLAELGYTSLKQVDGRAGFDRLKGRLQALNYRIEGGTEAAFPDVGEMRRHLWIITSELFPRLAKVHPEPERYLGRILRDRFGQRLCPADLAENPAIGPRNVRHLLYTLTRAVRRLEAAAKAQALDKPLKTTPEPAPAGQIEAPPEIGRGQAA